MTATVLNNKTRAHECLTQFHRTCDAYNKHGLLDGDYKLPDSRPASYLRVIQSMTIEALDLFKFLNEKEPCEATRAYIIFAKKILLRLSYLIHHGRRETDAEAVDYWRKCK